MRTAMDVEIEKVIIFWTVQRSICRRASATSESVLATQLGKDRMLVGDQIFSIFLRCCTADSP